MEKYRKIQVIGKGSFGFAVLVQSVEDRKTYVMKIIDVSKMDKAQQKAAINEVHVLKQMRHPYIISYKESFVDRNKGLNLCIVMDYADGGDLYTKIAKQRQIGKVCYTEDQILDWFVQMALALKHIHDKKTLHRDLKTQNIFMNKNGQIKIGDFGIARVLQHTYDCAQTAIGTPYYLSPEICQEKPYNQKSDIWSLGCILYEMVTLRHAFDANSMKGLVLKILKGTYPPIPSHYSQDMKDLLADMLIKDPAKRPSMRKVLEKEFISRRISKLLTATIAKNEFTQTFIDRHLMMGEACIDSSQELQEEDKEQCNDVSNERVTVDANLIQSAKPKINIKQPQNAVKKLKVVSAGKSPVQVLNNNNTKQSSILQQSVTQGQHSTSVINQISSQENLELSSQRQNSGLGPRFGNYVGNESTNSFNNVSKQDQSKKILGHSESTQIQYNKYIDGSLAQQPSKQSSTNLNKPSSRLHQPLIESKTPVEGTGEVAVSSDSDSSSDNVHEEPPEEHATPEFLKNLPGVQASDSMAYRIEALRVYLETVLGEQAFVSAYQHFVRVANNQEEEIEDILNKDKVKFLPLIHHLIFCEDSYFSN